MAYTQKDKERDLRLLDLAEKRYNFEIQRLKDLDSKASNLIGYVSVITTLILGIGAFQYLNSNLLEKDYSIVYFAGIFSLVCSITSSLIGMLVRNYHFRPNIGDIDHFFRTPDANELNIIRDTIAKMNDAVRRNFKINNQKGICILISNSLLIVGIILLLSYTMAFTYEQFNAEPVRSQHANQTSISTLSQIDNRILMNFFSGKRALELAPNETINVISPDLPHTNLPWIETQFQ